VIQNDNGCCHEHESRSGSVVLGLCPAAAPQPHVQRGVVHAPQLEQM
jgi:hypothetical protein